MPSVRQPRSGSLQFWPRKRCKREYARVRTTPASKETGIIGFAGYKAGMTHVMATETKKTSHLKGEQIAIPVTIIECPPMKIASIRLYTKDLNGLKVKKEIFLSNNKDLSRKVKLAKKTKAEELDKLDASEYVDVRVLVYTQPRLTNIGKKKPELFELAVSGPNIADKIAYVKSHVDKEITIDNIFKEGEMVDLKSITTGRGFQGARKRFGISLRQSKSEKNIRTPGSLGPWCGQGHILWRVAHAGKMGYHQRTEYNKCLMKIMNDGKDVTPKGGILRFGVLKNKSILIKGSVSGPKKRMIMLLKPMRPQKKTDMPTIEKISLQEKQGN